MSSPGTPLDAPIDWAAIDAVLFDLDGVLTPTAAIHERAWKEMFDGFLRRRAAATGEPFVPFSADDYLSYVDGKPRFDGVRSFVRSRGIDLPEGSTDDEPGDGSIGALGNSKNAAFQHVLRSDGIEPYPGSLRFLDELERRQIGVAVVSSSRNAPEVLEASGLADRFTVVVDGSVAAAAGLHGKPAPDTFLAAADRLNAPAARSIVVEDALSGVAAGRAGGFVVVGVDRGAGRDALASSGADVVVDDLADLLPLPDDSPTPGDRP
jgi:beta-phosphoglucomutase family hydrolase